MGGSALAWLAAAEYVKLDTVLPYYLDCVMHNIRKYHKWDLCT
jgi:hypothetical protein